MRRIEITDTGMSVILKMTEGNPGAATVLLRLLGEGDAIDPQAFDGGFAAILSLDSYEVYGGNIWKLYKDVCREDLMKTMATLRACQLGHISQAELHYAINNRGRGLDVDALVVAVKDKLKEFGGGRPNEDKDTTHIEDGKYR